MSLKFTLTKAICCFVVILIFIGYQATAQVSMGRSITHYQQDFDGLPNKENGTWTSGTEYFPNWKLHRTKTELLKDGVRTELNALTVNTGTSNTGGLYSYGATDSPDRALGSLGSLNYGEFAYGLLLQNNTSSTILSLDISYFGEQWRSANSTTDVHRITFWYAISNDKSSFNLWPTGDKGWTQVNELTFYSPVFKSAGSPLNGNAAANRRHLFHTLPVNIPDGYYVMLRWKDADEPEADHGLAIDDVSVSWSIEASKGPAPLPVELTAFTAKAVGKSVILQWETAMEEANDHFVIERSMDGRAFEGIGIEKGNGTTSQKSKYTFTDESPLSGTFYYRLKQVDEDASFSYSSSISIMRHREKEEVSVFPTTTSDTIQIECEAGILLKQATVMDVMGKQVLNVSLPFMKQKHILNVVNLPSSYYVLVLQDENGRTFTRRIRKI